MTILRRLYVGKNRGANLAEQELQDKSVQYIVIKSDDEKMDPVLVTEEGYFEGVEKITEYAKYWAPLSRYGNVKLQNSIYVF